MATITWLGHAGFLIRSGDQKLVIDGWLHGPTYPGADISGAEFCVVSHGHYDHAEDAPAICNATGATLVCIHEIKFWAMQNGVKEDQIVAMNIGGSFAKDGWRLTMVQAVHSGGCPGPEGSIVAGGAAAGWIIECPDGTTIYHAGDTAVFSDMRLIGEMYKPQIALLPIGGHFTMDAKAAAKAIDLIGVKHVIPMHYGTYPILAGTPGELGRHAAADVHIHAIQAGDALDTEPLFRRRAVVA